MPDLFVPLVQIPGHLLGQLSLANSGRAEEEKDERMLVVGPAVLLPTDRPGHCGYGTFLNK